MAVGGALFGALIAAGVTIEYFEIRGTPPEITTVGSIVTTSQEVDCGGKNPNWQPGELVTFTVAAPRPGLPASFTQLACPGRWIAGEQVEVFRNSAKPDDFVLDPLVSTPSGVVTAFVALPLLMATLLSAMTLLMNALVVLLSMLWRRTFERR